MNKKSYFLILIVISLTVVLIGGGCNKIKDDQAVNGISTAITQNTDLYKGETGSFVAIQNAQVILDSSIFDDGLARFYNTVISTGKTVYFFVVKDKSGTYRAAANACQICFDTRTGFHQEGNYMVCNTCGNKYPLEKVATEKGGCNPIPINPNLRVANNQVIIDQMDIEEIDDFF